MGYNVDSSGYMRLDASITNDIKDFDSIAFDAGFFADWNGDSEELIVYWEGEKWANSSQSFMNMIKTYVTEGVLEFFGEDYAMWRYVHCEDQGWAEEYGEVVWRS